MTNHIFIFTITMLGKDKGGHYVSKDWFGGYVIFVIFIFWLCYGTITCDRFPGHQCTRTNNCYCRSVLFKNGDCDSYLDSWNYSQR